MANLTFKKRNITTNVVKCKQVQAICGKYKRTCQNEFDNALIYEHFQKKPKSFSVRNWMFPYIFATNEGNAESRYQDFKVWLDNQTKEFEIEVSCKLQHLSMCFDSPHFQSCGSLNSSRFEKANNKLVESGVFCIFTRDGRGLINNRCICRMIKNCVYVFSFYGSNKHLEGVFISLLEEVSKLPVKKQNSFL
jgi:hypothetical protein